MSKAVAGTTTQFAWDMSGGLPLTVRDGSTSIIYGADRLPLAQVASDGTTHWFFHDQLGSTRALTNSAGALAGTWSYDPSGKVVASTGPATTRFGFTGEYTDAETGFLYLRARFYDVATGQFLTRDPAVAQTREPYGYAGNNPTNNTDPTGLFCIVHNDDGGCKGARAIEKYADDVANVAGVVAGGCAVGAVLTSETVVGGLVFGGCYAVAETVSLSASTLHTAVTCADLDKYCRNSAGAMALNFASFGLSRAAYPGGSFLRGTDSEALWGLARWVGALNITFFGSVGGFMMDTQERPKDC
jgi:RHS repeat-associated protein